MAINPERDGVALKECLHRLVPPEKLEAWLEADRRCFDLARKMPASSRRPGRIAALEKIPSAQRSTEEEVFVGARANLRTAIWEVERLVRQKLAAGEFDVYGRRDRITGRLEKINSGAWAFPRYMRDGVHLDMVGGSVWFSIEQQHFVDLRVVERKSKGARRRRDPGRPKGAGRIDDAALVDEMHRLITERRVTSIEQAAKKVAGRAAGGGIDSSKIKRLVRNYRQKNGAITQ